MSGRGGHAEAVEQQLGVVAGEHDEAHLVETGLPAICVPIGARDVRPETPGFPCPVEHKDEI